MINQKKLSEVYSDFLTEKTSWSEGLGVFEIFKTSSKKYKPEILEMFDEAIYSKDTEKLRFCLTASFWDGLDKDYSDTLYNIILNTWHEEHEDIVDHIYWVRDERFCDPLLRIALGGEVYRKYDYESEPTLRKCVHALMAINTKRSRDTLDQLIATNNQNVKATIEIYRGR